MADCGHSNPFTHRYCVICGEALERIACPQCGQVGLPIFLHCSGCGCNLKEASVAEQGAVVKSTPVTAADDNKANLNELLDLLGLQEQKSDTAIKGKKMSQADIKALLKKRKK